MFIFESLTEITYKQIIMIIVGIVLITLAIKKKMEPALLLPIGFGAILINIPNSAAITHNGLIGPISWLFEVGIESAEIFPLLLFIGIGAMIDFGPLLSNPKLIFFGAAAQFGIFLTIVFASLYFPINDAAAIGIIGSADGPTTILVANKLNSEYFAQVSIAAYSYMALVPIFQPIAIKAVTTKKERLIRMDFNDKQPSQAVKIIFPIAVTIIAGFLTPQSVSLVGFLMFGNLIKECGVLKSLSETASKTLTNLVTLLLGLTIASKMEAESFVNLVTLLIMGLGLLAFIFDTIAGVLFGKFLNLFLKNKINPMIGAAGISAFPMSARVVQKLGLQEDPENHLLMHAVSANVSGQIASVLAGGIVLSILL